MAIVGIKKEHKEERMRTGLFNMKEDAVLEMTGLTKNELKEIRKDHLYQDEDFGKVGREICYAEEVMAKIRQIIKKTAAPGVTIGDLVPMKVTEGPADPDKPTVILEAIVRRVYPHINKKIVEATLGGQPIVIRVENSTNFNEKMVIPASKLAMKNPRVFDFIGRYPRARGIW